MEYRQDHVQGPPPPYGMNPPPGHVPPPTTTVIVQSAALGAQPCNIQCPSCHAMIQTRVDYEANTKTHLFALLLCLICCPCGLIPYCTDSCKSANHYCPSCGTFLGTFSD